MGRILFSLMLTGTAAAQSLSGLWSAEVTVNGLQIPFRFELSDKAQTVQGSFFNGEDKVTSNGGSFREGKLVLNFDFYASRLQAELKDGVLEGSYGREGRTYPFHATRFTPPTLDENKAPAIAGLWEVGVKSPKGESAWRFIVRQSGPEVSAAILRVDGDTGTLEGTWRDG